VNRRVVVTGCGAVTPLALSVPKTWRLLLEGKSGVGTIERFDASPLPVQIAGEVPALPVLPPQCADERLVRHSIYALSAAAEAVQHAELDCASLEPGRFGVVLGAGDGRVPTGTVELGPLFAGARREDGTLALDELEASAVTAIPAHLWREGDPMGAAARVARYVGARGINRTCLTACAASSQAIGEAFKAIAWGDADVILAGGSQSLITLQGLMGFTLLNALSKRNSDPCSASRPFDAERDGFVLSEGAAIVVLESYESARDRNAPILAEITGYGASSDAYRVTDPHPQGTGAILCMSRALDDAGLNPDAISYINAHGTSTKANDAAESVAIARVFNDRSVPVTANKSQLGHLIAAAGAIEFITCVLSIRDRVIPATMNYTTPDPQCVVSLVVNEPRDEVDVQAVVSNSFGFGGQNVSLVVSRFDD